MEAPQDLHSVDDVEAATENERSRALDCCKAVFAHAVNSQAKLSSVESDNRVTILETDVVMGPLVTIVDGSSARSAPVALCSHDIGSTSDLSFQDVLARAAALGKGLKADIKEWSALGPVLQCLRTYVAQSGREETDPMCKPAPLFAVHSGPATMLVPAFIVNADILTGTVARASSGPGLASATAYGCTFNAAGRVLSREAQIEEGRTFIEAIVQAVPLSIVSPGWTTVGEGSAVDPLSTACYTDEMVDDMLAVVSDYAAAGVHFTFPVRATYVRASIGPLSRLLQAVQGSSLTVWSNIALPAEEEAWIRAHLDKQFTMYDLLSSIGTRRQDAHDSTVGDKYGVSMVPRAMLVGCAVTGTLMVTLFVMRTLLQLRQARR